MNRTIRYVEFGKVAKCMCCGNEVTISANTVVPMGSPESYTPKSMIGAILCNQCRCTHHFYNMADCPLPKNKAYMEALNGTKAEGI